MSRLQEADGLGTCFNDNLRNEFLIVVFGKHWLNAVGLGADGVNEGDVLAVQITINVVAAWKSVSGGSGKRGRKNHAVQAFHRHEMFAHDESRRAVVGETIVKLSRVIFHQNYDCGFG